MSESRKMVHNRVREMEATLNRVVEYSDRYDRHEALQALSTLTAQAELLEKSILNLEQSHWGEE